jgi:predicted permease
MPMALIAIAAFLPMPLEMRQVLLLQAAMPAAVFSVILTRLYEQDVKTAVAAIIGTSIIGLISIPVWLYVGQALLPGSN